MSQNKEGHNTHLFQVEILVEDETNARALERLLHALNNGGFADYRVLSGIELGRIIDAVRGQTDDAHRKSTKAAANASIQAAPAAASKGKSASAQAATLTTSQPARPAKQAAATDANPFTHITAEFRNYMAQNKLIRLKINKGLGVSLSIPGRIINLDEDSGLLTVYHVDEKQVYTFKLNEIDDYSV